MTANSLSPPAPPLEAGKHPSTDRAGWTWVAAIAFVGFLVIAIDWALGTASLLETDGSLAKRLFGRQDCILHLYGFLGVFAALRLILFGLQGRRAAGPQFHPPWVRLALYLLVMSSCVIASVGPSTLAQYEAKINEQAIVKARALGLTITHWRELEQAGQTEEARAIAHWAWGKPPSWHFGHKLQRLVRLLPIAFLWLSALVAELLAAFWRWHRQRRALTRAA